MGNMVKVSSSDRMIGRFFICVAEEGRFIPESYNEPAPASMPASAPAATQGVTQRKASTTSTATNQVCFTFCCLKFCTNHFLKNNIT